MGEEPVTEMRQGSRVLMSQGVEVDGKQSGHLIDLSVTGAYVSADVSVITNSVVNLKFELMGRLIEVQGKVVILHEGVGMGVKFLSLKPEDARKIKAYVGRASSQGQSNARGWQILIIDDTHFYREAYRQRFEAEGFSVLVAQDGVGGLRLLLKEHPDVILLDLMMDGMDAFKVLHIIKSRPEVKHIPVFILSDRSTPQDVKRTSELGASELLVKATATPDKVAEKINAILNYRPTLF